MVVVLSDGDLLRAEEIKYRYTLPQVEPFLKFNFRKLLFREAVIRFLVGETEDEKQKRLKEQYRKLALKAGKALPEDFELRELN